MDGAPEWWWVKESRFLRFATEWKCKRLRNGNAKEEWKCKRGMEMQKATKWEWGGSDQSGLVMQ